MSEYFVKLKSIYLNDITEVKIVMPNPPMRTAMSPEEFYSSGEKYKVLWLLHGGRNTLRDWFSFSSVARLALQYGIMLVMPDGHDSDYVNHPEIGDGYYFSDFFFQELMPFIYHWFPASSNPKDNFLAGNSMGCAATWQYGLLHPGKFGCIAPLCNQPLDYSHLEPHRQMSTSEFRAAALADEYAFKPAYGGVGEGIHIKEVNTICKYETVGDFLDSIENTMPRFREAAESGRLPQAWVPCGTEPRDRKLLEFKDSCEKAGLDSLHFEVFEGDTHNFEFWEKSLGMFLEYLKLPKINYFIGV